MRNIKSLNHYASELLIGASIALLIAGIPAAHAQDRTAADNGVEEIVVTGSSIRGVPPTGSNLIQLGQEQVVESGAATMQELLATVPQLGTFNQAPRPDPHSNGLLSTAPNIRGLGQWQTLVLVNGHRLVGTGHLQNIADPSIIPPSAVSRVEVVADGASSVYGSDAIAGVVNVITVREYDGFQGAARYGFGDDYDLTNTNFVTGSTWDTGGVVASVEFSATSRLEGSDRDFVTNDFTPWGGIDDRSQNNCIPSSFRINDASGSPTGDYIEYGTGAHNVRCDNSRYTDLYPQQERLSFFTAGHQEIGDNVELFFDAFHSKTDSDAYLSPAGGRGTMTRSNPFFPTSMVDPEVDSITSYYNVSNLTGVRLKDKQSVRVFGATVGADVNVSEFLWTTYATGSRSNTDLHEGSYNAAANAAALAGTTIDTALDPFTGRTSDQVKVGLANYEQFFGSEQYLWELNTKIDGPLFALPGGEAKIALGAVYRKEFYDGKNTLSRIGFMENLGAQIGRRTVYSGFAELFIPVVGYENAKRGIRRLDLSLSGRYDNYSDFGSTFNPKIGVTWAPIDSVTLRTSYGKSFHAPALPDLFGPDTRAGYGGGGLTPAGVTPQRTGSIYIAGGNSELDAEEATTWSLGFDVAPESLPGLNASMTYYNIEFTGRIDYPDSQFFYVLPEFNQFFIDNIVCDTGTYPNGTGCTSLPIDPQVVYDTIEGLRLQNFPRPVTSPADLPPVYIISILRRQNLAVIETSGIDFAASYGWDTDFASMNLLLQGNRILNFDQTAIPGAPTVDQFPFGQARLKMRAALSAETGPVRAVATLNYNHEYQAQYLAFDGTTTEQSVETVDAFTTLDLHLGLDLPGLGFDFGEGTELTLDVDNLLGEDPPRIRSDDGYGVGYVLGRVVTLGIRQQF